MKQDLKILNHILILSILLLLSACKEIDYFEETEEGRNTFAFTIEGNKIHQSQLGGFPSEYPLERRAWYRIAEECGSIEISAALSNKKFVEISIWLALKDVYSDAIVRPDSVALYYLYLPRVNGPLVWKEYLNGNGGWWAETVVRWPEYRKANITESQIKIRKWSADERVLAGNFTMRGEYSDSIGKTHTINIKDGVFDLTDNQYPKH